MTTFEEILEAYLSAMALVMYYQEVGDEDAAEWWRIELDKINNGCNDGQVEALDEALKHLVRGVHDVALAWKEHGHL